MSPLQFEVNPAEFRCRLLGWVETAREKEDWHRLILDVVTYAFARRPATIVTISPMEWSIGNSLPSPRNLSREGRRYLVNEVDECSTEMLTEITESEDFQRGLLWILAPPSNEDDLLMTVARLETSLLDVPRVEVELVLLLDDARCIHWLSPSRDASFLERDLSARMRAQGWELT